MASLSPRFNTVDIGLGGQEIHTGFLSASLFLIIFASINEKNFFSFNCCTPIVGMPKWNMLYEYLSLDRWILGFDRKKIGRMLEGEALASSVLPQ